MLYTDAPLPFAEFKNEYTLYLIPSWPAHGHLYVLNLMFIFFEVCHPRCVSNKSNYNVYVYIVKHNYILGGMLFIIRKAQLHVSALIVGHLQVVQ